MSTILLCTKCGNVWNYGGSCERATCPTCRGKVRVADNEVENIEDMMINLHNRLRSLEDTVDDLDDDFAEARSAAKSAKALIRNDPGVIYHDSDE